MIWWSLKIGKVNATTLEYAKYVLNKKLGGWPLVTGEDNPNSPLDLLAKLYKYEHSPIIALGTDTNPLNVSQRIIYVNYKDKNFLLFLFCLC